MPKQDLSTSSYQGPDFFRSAPIKVPLKIEPSRRLTGSQEIDRLVTLLDNDPAKFQQLYRNFQRLPPDAFDKKAPKDFVLNAFNKAKHIWQRLQTLDQARGNQIV